MLLKAKDIQEAVFATSMSGYKKEEVDALLDKILEDYQNFEVSVAAQQNRIAELEKELSEKNVSMNSINTVLISAQKLADDIVDDAKKKAEETVEAANIEAENIKLRTKKALEEIDAVLTEQKDKAQVEVDMMLKEAARKSEGMILAAKDSVAREQFLFDKLKSEVAQFKSDIKNTYKEHLESLSKLPEEVVLNPELAASTIEEIINNEPDLLKFIEKTPLPIEPTQEVEEQQSEETVVNEEIDLSSEEEFETETIHETEKDASFEQTEEFKEEVKEPATTGFIIQVVEDDEEEAEDDSPNFSKGFFAKHK